MHHSEGSPQSGGNTARIRPPLEQFISQGLVTKINPRISIVAEGSRARTDDMFIASKKLCPTLPDEGRWISLAGLSEDEKHSLDILFSAAQRNGIVFTRYNCGHIGAKDTSSIEGYSIDWYWMNVDSLGTERGLSEVGIFLRNEDKKGPDHGSIQEAQKNIRSIPDLIQNTEVGVIVIGNEIADIGTVPIITDICFDPDTIFEGRELYMKLMESIAKRMDALLGKLKK